MRSNVEQRLVKARNELNALKTAMELAYSSVLFPENTPEKTWSGAIAFNFSNDVIARFRVRFTRTDGNEGAPYVDFAQNVTFSPTYADYIASRGGSVTGNDTSFVDDQNYTGYVAGAGDNYVDYYIDFIRDLMSTYYTLDSINITIRVQAISMVQGDLTITRII